MGKKEKIFPLSTVGGRIQDKRRKLNLSRSKLYDLIYQNGIAGSDSSKEKTVYNWESGETELNYDTLSDMCKALKCSSDFLLGLDKCTDKSTQFIHEYTGLSEDAIKRLHKFTTYTQGKVRLTIIDKLLCNTHFSIVLMDKINDYYAYYDLYKNRYDSFLKSDSEARKVPDNVKDVETKKDATCYVIQKNFDDILENLMEFFYNQNNKAPGN